MSTKNAELILVRHGETTWNASGRLQGQAESELNETGKRQAHAVAERLAKEKSHIYAVYSSDLKRAHDTAQIIAEKLSCSKGSSPSRKPKCIFWSIYEAIRVQIHMGFIKVETCKGLRERHLGNLQGLTKSEARSLQPKAYKAFASLSEDEPIPGGGESLGDLFTRTKATIEGIAQENQGRRVLIVTHGGFLRALHILSNGIPSPGGIQNASINIISISDENEWTILSWGDIRHLKGVGHLSSRFGGDKESG